MSIKKQIDFDGKGNWGYVDCGSSINSEKLEAATQALVLIYKF